MDLDMNKLDDAVLALLCLGLHDGARAWKGFDWEAMNRLHERSIHHGSAWQGEIDRLHRRRIGAREAAS